MFYLANIRRNAANLRGGKNPPYTLEDFKAFYPFFFKEDGDSRVPDEVLALYIEAADAAIKKRRFHSVWKQAMALFVAHFATLYLQAQVPLNATDAEVVNAGQLKGLTSSKSVDSVSISMDYSVAISDLNGYGAWKLTQYGVQLATFIKMYSIGGMYVS